MAENLEHLKRSLSLLDYLRRSNWTARRMGTTAEFVGLCPLHRETRPSFYVNGRKNLFYCHGCGRGGDLIRFVELSQGLSFRQSVARLLQEIPPTGPGDVLEQAVAFYQLQLHRHSEAVRYLQQRGLRDPVLIQELGIGYAPGGSLRRHLGDRGCSFDLLLRMGLINDQGRDAFCRRVIFPCRQQSQIVNLYGRSRGPLRFFLWLLRSPADHKNDGLPYGSLRQLPNLPRKYIPSTAPERSGLQCTFWLVGEGAPSQRLG